MSIKLHDMIYLRVMLTSSPNILVKNHQFKNYFIKKSNILNSNTLDTYIFIT